MGLLYVSSDSNAKIAEIPLKFTIDKSLYIEVIFALETFYLIMLFKFRFAEYEKNNFI